MKLNLITELFSQLSKRKRARLLIENYKLVTPRNGRYSNEMLEAKEKFYDDFINIK